MSPSISDDRSRASSAPPRTGPPQPPAPTRRGLLLAGGALAAGSAAGAWALHSGNGGPFVPLPGQDARDLAEQLGSATRLAAQASAIAASGGSLPPGVAEALQTQERILAALTGNSAPTGSPAPDAPTSVEDLLSGISAAARDSATSGLDASGETASVLMSLSAGRHVAAWALSATLGQEAPLPLHVEQAARSGAAYQPPAAQRSEAVLRSQKALDQARALALLFEAGAARDAGRRSAALEAAQAFSSLSRQLAMVIGEMGAQAAASPPATTGADFPSDADQGIESLARQTLRAAEAAEGTARMRLVNAVAAVARAGWEWNARVPAMPGREGSP